MPSGSPTASFQARGKNRLLVAIIAIALATATVLVFRGVAREDFTDLDDQDYVRENIHVNHGLNWPDTVWAFTRSHSCNWHPLTWLSHALDCQLYGLHPAGHHVTNLIFHTANVILLFLLLSRITATPGSGQSTLNYHPSALWRSAFIAGVFALHPLHVESVAWISERKDVLCGFFFLLTLLAYERYVQSPKSKVQSPAGKVPSSKFQVSSSEAGEVQSPPLTDHASRITHHAASLANPPTHSAFWYVCALLFFAFGLMSKPMIVTLPFILLLLDYWPLGRLGSSKFQVQSSKFTSPSSQSPSSPLGLLLEKLPFFALSLGSSLITMFVQKGSQVSLTSVSPWERLGNAALAYVAYLRQTLWPTKLAVFYPYPESVPVGSAIAAAGFLFAITILFVVLAVRSSKFNVQRSKFTEGSTVEGQKERRPSSNFQLSTFNFQLSTAPPSGNFQLSTFNFQLSTPALLVGWLWFLGMLVPVIGLVQVGTQSRADRYTYLPSIGLFMLVAWGLSKTPSTKHQAPEKLQTPNTKASRNRWSLEFGAFLELGVWCLVFLALAVLLACALLTHRQLQYWRTNRLLFEHAVEVVPNNYYALSAVGFYDLRDGDAPRAITNLLRSLEIEPDYPLANHHLGFALQHQRRFAEAIPYLHKAEPQPGLIPPPALLLAISFMETGDFPAAESALERVSRERPDYPDIPITRAGLLFKQGKFAEAEPLYRQAAAAHPEMPGPQRSLADLLVSLGRPAEALPFYEAALKLQPSDTALRQAYAAALNNAAWLLATSPDEQKRNGKRAVELAVRACELGQWQAPVLMGTLAAAYAEAGRFSDAVAMAEKARDQAREQKDDEVAKRNEELLKLYRAGQPYRETSQKQP